MVPVRDFVAELNTCVVILGNRKRMNTGIPGSHLSNYVNYGFADNLIIGSKRISLE